MNRRLSLLILFVSGFAVISLYLFYIPGFDEKNATGLRQVISYDLRLPRLVFLLGIGGALSVLGGVYQILFRNALAEPYVLGVSSAVSLAAAGMNTAAGFELNSWPVLLVGCLAGVGSAFLLLAMGKLSKSNGSERLLLFGMSLNFVLSSLLFLYLTYASQQLGGGSIQWLFGHIPWLEKARGVMFLGVSLFFVALWYLMARRLDVLSLGDTVARTLGVSPMYVRSFYVVTSSLYIGLVVSQTGAIGFVGLVVPHAARLVFRPSSSRMLFAYSFLVGGFFLLVSDFLSRNLLPPLEFPIGIVTTIVGAPLFLWLLWKR